MKRETYFKSLLAFLLLMVGANVAWADDFTPTSDVFFRTSNDNTGWNSTTFPQTASDCGDGQFAGNHNAGMFALQKYQIPNISAVKTLTLTLTGTTSNTPDALAVWVYSTNDWSSAKTTENASTVATAYQSVVGVALHSSGTANTTYLVDGTNTKESDGDIRYCKYSISGDKLTALKNAAAADGTFTLLITHTTSQISSGGNTDRKFYCSAHTTEAYRPKITVTYDKVGVTYGDNTKTAYSSFEAARSAVASAAQDATITVMEDQNITSRVNAITGKTVNIIAGVDGVTLTNTASNTLSFLANASNAGTINVGSADHSIIIKNSATTTNNVVETSGNSTDAVIKIENVTFKDITSSNELGLIKANNSSGTITLKNVTFDNCSATADNAGIIYSDATDRIFLSGDLSFTNCTGYNFHLKGRVKESSLNELGQVLTIYSNNIALNASAVVNMNTANREKYVLVNENRCVKPKGNSSGSEELVVSEAYTLSVPATNATTLILPFATTIPTGVTAYTLAYTNGAATVKGTQVETTLPANTPVYISATGSESGTKYKFNASTRATSATAASTEVEEANRTNGALTGVYSSANITSGYVLSGTSFAKVTESTAVPAYSAYLTATETAPTPLTVNTSGVEYTITANEATNGTLTVSPSVAGAGETITVTATPNETYTLTALKYNDGSDHDIPIESTPYTFEMPAVNVTVSATFAAPATQYTLTIGEMANGKIQISGEDAATAQYDANTELTLTAVPTNASTYEFDKWTSDGTTELTANEDNILSISGSTMNVKMTKAFTVIATFKEKSASPTAYTITKAAATNGSFTVKVSDSEVTEAAEGATVTITTTPAENYEVDAVTVTKTSEPTAVTVTTVTANTTYTFAMPAEAVTVTVTFKASTPATYPVYIGETGYSTLQDAVTAATDGAVIEISDNLVTTRVTFPANVSMTIKPKAGINATISRSSSQDGALLLMGNAGSQVVTIEGTNDTGTLIFDEISKGGDAHLVGMEANSSKFVLNNLTIKNAKGASNGVINLKDNTGSVEFNNITFNGCAPNTYFRALSSNLTPKGTITFTDCTGTGSTFMLKEGKTIDVTNLTTNEAAFTVTIVTGSGDTPNATTQTVGSTYITGATGKTTKFELTNNGYGFEEDSETAGNLKVKAISYPVYNTTTGYGYATLADAVNAAVDNDVIEVYESHTTGRVTFKKDVNLTIKPKADTNVTVTRSSSQNGALLLMGTAGTSEYTVTINGTNGTGKLNFYENKSGDALLVGMEANNAKIVLNDVTVTKAIGTTNGVINLKDITGKVEFNNITFVECDPNTYFRVLSSNMTPKGTITFTDCTGTGSTFMLKDGKTIDVTNLTTNEAAFTVTIITGSGSSSADQNTTTQTVDRAYIINVPEGNAAKYTLTNAGYRFKTSETSLVVEEIAYDYSKTYKVTGVGSFDTLAGALASSDVTDGATIIVQAEEITLDAQVAFAKSVTIVPSGDALTIKRATTMTGESDKVLFSLGTSEKTVTIGGDGKTITIDGQMTAESTITSNKQLVEVTNGTLNLINTTIKNYTNANTTLPTASGGNRGVISATGSGMVSLNGVTFSGCKATADNAGVVFCGKAEGVVLNGNNTFDDACTEIDFFLEQRLKVDGAITGSPYNIYSKSPSENLTVVMYADAANFSDGQFVVQNPGYKAATALAGSGNKELKLAYVDYTITLTATPDGYGTIAADLADLTKAHIGATITLTASPATNKQLSALKYNDGSDHTIDISTSPLTFTMPAHDVTVTATFADFANFNHPAMLHTTTDINNVKEKLGLSPVKDAWAHLQASNYASASYTNKTGNLGSDKKLKRMNAANWGPSGTHGKYSDYDNYKYAMQDANAAYQLALRYRISGETQYATAAVNILNAWASNCTGVLTIEGSDYANNIPDPNEYLITIQGHQFANAAELLRGYSGWADADFTNFKTWIKKTFVTELAMPFLQNHHNNVGNKHYWLNWDLAALTSVLSVGILCDDKTLTDYAINYYKGTATTSDTHNSSEEVGYYANAIPTEYTEDGTVGLGQCQESGRDQGHSTLDVALLAAFCQMAKNLGSDGEDLFATDNYRAVKMAEYVGKYNLRTDETYNSDSPEFQNATIDWTNYGTGQTVFDEETQTNVQVTHTAISADKRGTKRPGWEIFYAYAREKRITAKYSEAWAMQMRSVNGWGDGGAGDYGTTSGGFDQLGYGTLMYAEASADGQDTDNLSAYSAYEPPVTKTAQGDTYVRSNSVKATNGGTTQIEVYNGKKEGNDAKFYGMLSFNLPNAAIGHVKKAQLRLTTKRYKTGRNINVYAYNSFDEANASYETESGNITTATGKTQLATFKPMGDSEKDVTSDDVTTTTQDGWTNKIDLTSYVQSLTTKEVNLLLTDAGTGTNDDAVQFFSKEWTDAVAKISVTDGSTLQPQLIIYHDGVSTGVFEVDGVKHETLEDALEDVADGGTILVKDDATIGNQVSFSKNVTIKSDSETTARTLKRGVSDKVLYLMSANKTVNFENIVFDENNATAKPLMELNNSQKFALKNVTIQNSKYTGGDGLLDVKNGTLTLNNVTFKDCALTNAYIRTAKADGGGLDFAGKVTFTNSTGNHLKLRASASIDGAAVLNAITAPVTIEINGADYEKLSMTNVTDLSKFKLVNDGYSMVLSDGKVTFTKESDGQDADDLTKYDGTSSSRTPEADTFVRSTSADTKYGTANNIEVHTNADADFAGLLSFRLPGNAVAEGAEIKKVQLKLVTKQKKSTNGIYIYPYGSFSEDDTYTTQKDAVAAARQKTAIAKFYPKGQNNMDVTSDGAKTDFKDENKKLEMWENRIDLTSYVKGLEGRDVNLLLSAAVSDGLAVQFFSKDWTTDLSTSAGTRAEVVNAITASASELVPQLIVIYKGSGTTNTFVIEGEGSYATLHEALADVADGGTILVTKDATVDDIVSFSKNVTIKSDGSSVRTLKRGSNATSILYKMEKSVTVNFENIVFDENGFASRPMMELNTNHKFVLKDVTIQNSKYTGSDGLLDVKNGTLTLNGVTFKDNTLSSAHIRTAKADGGGLDFAGKVTFSNSKGSHIRLRGEASIDGEKVLSAISAPVTIEINEADFAKLSITNVSDASKFELTTLGYTMVYRSSTITFDEEADGQDSKNIDVPTGAQKETVTSLGDTYVRKGNNGDNGKKNNMEVYTFEDSDNDLDFVGLLSFKLPTDLTREGAKLYKAQLRLVGKRVKGSRVIDMYAFYRDFDESAVYDQMSSTIEELRNGERMHRFHAKGEAGMDIESDVAKLSDDYKNIEAWTNRVDLTDLVANAMHDDGKVRLALMSPQNSKDAKQFYTKEATGISNDVMSVDAEELVPQLVLVYDPGVGESMLTAKNIEATPNADTFVRKGSTSDNSVSTAIEVYTYKSGDQDIDFVGLMSFNLSSEVQTARTRAQNGELEVFSATLRLVSKRVRGDRGMNLYAFDENFSNKSTYAELEGAIQETRENGKKVSFMMAGQDGKDITTDGGLTGNYKTSITAWTNEIDVSSLIKDTNASTLRLMLSAADNGRDSKQFFSSEAESFTNENNKDFIVADENLWPLLTISFRNPIYTDIEETITIPITDEKIYDLRGNRVQTMGKGVYIINGKKVLKK